MQRQERRLEAPTLKPAYGAARPHHIHTQQGRDAARQGKPWWVLQSTCCKTDTAPAYLTCRFTLSTAMSAASAAPQRIHRCRRPFFVHPQHACECEEGARGVRARCAPPRGRCNGGRMRSPSRARTVGAGGGAAGV
eukprot:6087333-Pleurochrysis_carterae.AAC.1